MIQEGHNKTRSVKKRTPSKLLRMKTKKAKKVSASEQEKEELLAMLSKIQGLPKEIKENILTKSRKQIDQKLKNDLKLFLRLKNLHKNNGYNNKNIRESIKTFFSLPLKYKKGFVLALENDIPVPHDSLFVRLTEDWQNIVKFIGTHGKQFDLYQSSSMSHFISSTYGQTRIPHKVSFRQIVYDVNEYLTDMTYDYDYDW